MSGPTGAWVLPMAEPVPYPVTVLVLSHRKHFLGECLESLRRQTTQDFNLLVTHSAEWWGDKVNDLASIVRTRWLCVLCDDDLLAPTYLERTLAAAQSGVDLVFTDIQFFGDRTDAYALPDFGINTFRHAAVPWMTALVKTSLWRELGGFDPEQIFQDTEFWVRCAKAGARAAHVRAPLLLARQHAGNGAKLLDVGSAALRLQTKHPDLFPGPFEAGRRGPAETPVPVLYLPERVQALERLREAGAL